MHLYTKIQLWRREIFTRYILTEKKKKCKSNKTNSFQNNFFLPFAQTPPVLPQFYPPFFTACLFTLPMALVKFYITLPRPVPFSRSHFSAKSQCRTPLHASPREPPPRHTNHRLATPTTASPSGRGGGVADGEGVFQKNIPLSVAQSSASLRGDSSPKGRALVWNNTEEPLLNLGRGGACSSRNGRPMVAPTGRK